MLLVCAAVLCAAGCVAVPAVDAPPPAPAYAYSPAPYYCSTFDDCYYYDVYGYGSDYPYYGYGYGYGYGYPYYFGGVEFYGYGGYGYGHGYYGRYPGYGGRYPRNPRSTAQSARYQGGGARSSSRGFSRGGGPGHR